jgi:hypothetical protein
MYKGSSFIGQKSCPFLHRIILRNFYNLRQTILTFSRWHNYSRFIRVHPSTHTRSPSEKILQDLFKYILTLFCSNITMAKEYSIFSSMVFII